MAARSRDKFSELVESWLNGEAKSLFGPHFSISYQRIMP